MRGPGLTRQKSLHPGQQGTETRHCLCLYHRRATKRASTWTAVKKTEIRCRGFCCLCLSMAGVGLFVSDLPAIRHRFPSSANRGARNGYCLSSQLMTPNERRKGIRRGGRFAPSSFFADINSVTANSLTQAPSGRQHGHKQTDRQTDKDISFSLHTHTHTRTHARAHACTHAHTYRHCRHGQRYIQLSLSLSRSLSLHTHTHTHTRTYHTHTHIRSTHTHTHTRQTQIDAQTETHTHTHTHKHTQSCGNICAIHDPSTTIYHTKSQDVFRNAMFKEPVVLINHVEG